VPLPPARDPAIESAALPPPATEEPLRPTPPSAPLAELPREDDPACRALEAEKIVVATPLPPIDGPGACGSEPLVELSGVRRADGGLVEIKPAATVRCAMAQRIAAYVREDLAPAAQASGAGLARLEVAGSYVCRGRNGAAGGKMSEHGRANALDVSGFGLTDGRGFGVFAADLPKALADAARSGACDRFTTVLGPGSDSQHEDHLHLDLQPRRTKLCQWDASARAADKPEAGDAGGGPDELSGPPAAAPALPRPPEKP
jgi:hypothetical protein